MAGHEISTAYVSIVPSMRGVTKGIAKEFTGVTDAAEQAGRKSGNLFQKALKGGVKAATAAATATVTAAGATMAVGLTKGFKRLSSIDQARAKLRGLGNSSQDVAKIMGISMKAVEGTTIGLDEAATTAAGAVAAGIKPGKQLQATLKTVANVSQATGRTMDDMGSVFNQVAAGGKAYTVQVKQLADAGLPMWEKLGEVMGVSTEEVQGLVSAGKVGFKEFEEAAKLAAGTVAEEMSNTVPGAWSNMVFVLTRTGANLWGGINEDTGEMYGLFAKLPPLFNAITAALEPVEVYAARVGEALEAKLGPFIDRIVEGLDRFTERGHTLRGGLGNVLKALAPVGAAFAALGAGGLVPVISKLGPLAGLLGPIPKMLGLIGGPAGMAAAALLAFVAVDPSDMGKGFLRIAEEIPKMIEGMVGQVVAFATEVVPKFLAALIEGLPVLLAGMVEIIDSLALALLEAVPVLLEAAVELFGILVQAMIDTVPMLLEAAVNLIGELVQTLVVMIPQLIEGAITLFMALIQALTEIIPQLIEAVVELIPTIVTALIEMIPALLEGAVALFTGLIEAIPVILPALLVAVVGMIPEIVTALISMIPELMEGALELFMGIVRAIPDIVPELVTAVGELIPEMVTALVEGIPSMLEAGKDLINGLISGVGEMKDNAVEAVKGLGSDMLDGVKGFFGIQSPSTVFAKIGGFLDEGLAGGLSGGMAAIKSARSMSKAVSAPVQTLKKQFAGLSRTVSSQITGVIAQLNRLARSMATTFRARIVSELNAVGRAFRSILPTAVRSAMNGMRVAMSGLLGWVSGSFRKVMLNAVSGVGSAFKSMQVRVTASIRITRSSMASLRTWAAGGFRSSLVGAARAIRSAFVAVPGAVISSWARLRSGTARPANYVIRSVYMSGIRSATNAITRAANVSVSLPSVSGIGYATGGVLPGYTPGRDVHDFYNPEVGWLSLSGGEGILRPEVVQALGPSTIHAWNRARGRNVDSHAFASGGIVDFLSKGPRGWSVRTGGDFLTEFLASARKGMQKLVTEPAREYVGRAGGGSYGRAFGNPMIKVAQALEKKVADKAMPAVGDIPAGGSGKPGKAMGWQNLSRIIRGAGLGASISSAYRPGAITAVGTPSYHGLGRAIDIVPPSMKIFNWIAKRFPNATELIYSPAGGRQIYKGRNYVYGEPTRSMHFDHVHWSMNQGGLVPKLYDEGGWLMPGLTLAENKTSRPEPVFTSSQWDKLGGFPEQVTLRVEDGPTLRAYVEKTAGESLGAAGSLRSKIGVGV